MTYEKDIPEYALQPAKAPRILQAEAIYHTERIHYPAGKKTVICQIEEDILVPDTKADLREILFMQADCDITPEEKNLTPKADDSIQLMGMLNLQTLYQPEGETSDVIGISSRVPYQYMWNLNPDAEGEGVFSCCIKTLDYMVINERKFRIKVTLEITVELFRQQELQILDGLKDEVLEMKKTEMPLVCLSLVKKEGLTVDETVHLRETDPKPEKLLSQTFVITENYRQVTTEKIVINGFVFVHLLYLSKEEEGKAGSLCESHQRIEFTQFIPIDKAHRGKKWSVVKTRFSSHNLAVSMIKEEDSLPGFHIQGDIASRIELYETKTKGIVTDAYHREKNFCCNFNPVSFRNLEGVSSAECGLREVVNLKEGAKAAEAIGCYGRISECKCRIANGKPLAEGELEIICLWKDDEGICHSTNHKARFQQGLEGEYAGEKMTADCRAVMKNSFLTQINEKQLEFNGTVLLFCDIFAEQHLDLMESPGFTMEPEAKDFPMVVTTLKPGESLWDLAKRYRTTETQIRTVNLLESEPEPGRKILVMR